jgi:SNF2 family DNA or RNA helicase
MVSNPAVGGMGQTWVVANTVIYYSNSFSYEDRRQSEDRAHRKGQTNKVTYIDIEADHEYDKMILKAITSKRSVAEYVDKHITARQEHE